MTDHLKLIAQLEGPAGGDQFKLFREVAAALRELSRERDEARALQRDYRREQILAENDAAMVRGVWGNLQPKLEADIAHWKQVDSLRCEELAHTQAERDELRAETAALRKDAEAVKKRVKGLWETVVAVPRASPGSYDRGRNNGVADTLRAIDAALSADKQAQT